MINIRELLGRTLFARLIVIFLLMMIPVYFIGISIYNLGMSTVEAEILNSRLSQISSFMRTFESDIQRVKLLQSDVLNSDDINRLSNSYQYMNDYEKGSFMLKVQQRLNALKNTNIYIENAVAIIPSIRRTIPGSGSIRDLQEEDMIMLKLYDSSFPSQLIQMEGELYLNAGFPSNTFSKTKNPLYTIYIRFSTNELKKALKQFNYTQGSGSILMSSSLGFMTALSDETASIEQVESYVRNQLTRSQEGKNSVLIGKKKYLIIYTTSEYLGLTLCNFIPENQMFSSLKKFRILFWIFSLAAAVIIGLFTLSLYRFIQQPMKKMMKAFTQMEGGDLSFSIKHRYNDEFDVLYTHFNDMLAKLNTVIDQTYRQKIMIQNAELKQLQAQINPHFLYNSFFILHSMTRRGEYETLERFELQLGEYFKFITRSAADEVPLSREADHARTYCEIQQTRFSNRIRVIFGDPGEYADFIVPRLIIQPIVENAFEHGLENREENGLLQVIFNGNGHCLHIVIEDNGETLSDEEINELQSKIDSDTEGIETTGIVNIHRRIRLKFGRGSGIRVSRGDSGGLRVLIEITLE
jgi:two-component system, sensor histidine kinase YesM